MTDYSEQGAQPVDDAAVDDPPTEEEVRAAQAREYPDQAATADGRPGDAEHRHDSDSTTSIGPDGGADRAGSGRDAR